MNGLMVVDGKSRMTSREIADLMEKRHSHVLRDTKNLIEQGAINESSFGLVEYMDGKGEKRPEYLLDFDATMILITGYDAVRRAKVIKRWRELEEGKATPAFKLPKNYAEALRELADETEKTAKLQKRIELDRPKVELANAIAASNTAIPIKDFAQVISKAGAYIIGEKNFFKWLKHEKILDAARRPYQRYIDAGWFEVVQRENKSGNGPELYRRTLITGPGQVAVYKQFCNSKSRNIFLNKAAKSNNRFFFLGEGRA